MPIAPALPFVRDHIRLDEHCTDDLAILVVDGKNILDDGSAIAEDLALATATAAAVQGLEKQRLVLSVEDAADGIAAVERRNGVWNGMEGNERLILG